MAILGNAVRTSSQPCSREILIRVPRTKCVIYLDDSLVHAKTFEITVWNLEEMFGAIRAGNGLAYAM